MKSYQDKQRARVKWAMLEAAQADADEGCRDLEMAFRLGYKLSESHTDIIEQVVEYVSDTDNGRRWLQVY